MKLDMFTTGYIECALWSSVTEKCSDCDKLRDDSGDDCSCGGTWTDTPMNADYSFPDLSQSALASIYIECADFQEANRELLEQFDSEYGRNLADAGHDFWLTRNRHGSGFWDRGAGEVGTKLTEAAHAYGSSDLYVGDDGLIHVH